MKKKLEQTVWKTYVVASVTTIFLMRWITGLWSLTPLCIFVALICAPLVKIIMNIVAGIVGIYD
jgi:Na+/H+-translocating membrane pyrophosphatase